MYFIQHLLLNFKLIQQISQILSYLTFIAKFNCTFLLDLGRTLEPHGMNRRDES